MTRFDYRSGLGFGSILAVVESAVATAITLSWNALTPAQRTFPEWGVWAAIPVCFVIGFALGSTWLRIADAEPSVVAPCGNQNPVNHNRCIEEKGHKGSHRNGNNSWGYF